MGAPLKEDWYFCPTCGSEVIVGSDGCQTCAAREQDDADVEHSIHEADLSLANMRFGGSKSTEDFEFDEMILREFHGKSPTSITPVVIALALAVLFVVIFLIMATPRL